jgi:hypothetical protein
VDRHWAPRPRAVGIALDSYDKPYIIKFAPGGRYVVAATRNTRDGTFGVVIWDLETLNTPTALVRYQTRTLLSSLLDRWMLWEEGQGLALVMLRLHDGTKAIKKRRFTLSISAKTTSADPQEPLSNRLSATHRPRTLCLDKPVKLN